MQQDKCEDHSTYEGQEDHQDNENYEVSSG